MQLRMAKDAEYVFPAVFSAKIWTIMIDFVVVSYCKKLIMWFILIQVYGVLDVQRVAGNFHISVHGLNIFVAQKVSPFKLY